jgi:ATP-dependent DNA helicase PIF1
LRKKFAKEPDRVAVTASTGLAACNIGGVTLHSFSGIGLGKEPAEDLVKKIRRNQKAKQRWLRTKILIMDEVSMLDGDLFDKLEQIARTIRNNGRPFGGIQLVLTGDFFQLPPVPESGRQSKFAFDAGTWTTSIEHTIGLHQVFRQKDPEFASMLNEMREGRLTPASISAFRRLDRPLPQTDDTIEATELFPTRQEVERANSVRMQQLHGTVFNFEARDGGTIANKEQRDRLLQNCMVPEIVSLKKGAQVMLVKNMDDTLVNGSLGKVTNFMTEQMFNAFKEDEESFFNGGISEEALKREEMKVGFGLSTAQLFPVVRFTLADGTTRALLCKREDWKVELPNGEVQASRSQIPLILAWALSIHKAQGQTLERVRVDLGKVFEKGQAYVALSRATSMAGLQVLRFDPKKVIAHEKVRLFYSSLSRAEQVETKARSKTILGKMTAAR